MSASALNNLENDASLNSVLVSMDSRTRQTSRRINELSTQVDNISSSLSAFSEKATTALALSGVTEVNLSTLKKQVEELSDALEAVGGLLMDLVEEPAKSSLLQKSSSVKYVVKCTPPSLCAKVMAVIITVIALISTAVLIACVVAACGGFPIFVSLLNMYTIGACISLPILSCASVTALVLSSLSITSLLKNRLSIYIATKQNAA